MNIEPYKKRKKELKLTNSDIAERSGISKRTVEDFFRGFTEHPRIDTVQAIEKALGLDNSPWTEEDYANGVMDTKKESITPMEEEMLIAFRDIDTEDQQTLLIKIAKAMKDGEK